MMYDVLCMSYVMMVEIYVMMPGSVMMDDVCYMIMISCDDVRWLMVDG